VGSSLGFKEGIENIDEFKKGRRMTRKRKKSIRELALE